MSIKYKRNERPAPGPDPEGDARIVAKAMALAADPDLVEPEWVNLPEPFLPGFDWSSQSAVPEEPPTPRPVSRRKFLRYGAYVGGGAIAAGALVAVGGVIARWQKPREVEVAVAANVTTRGATGANGQILSEFEVSNRSAKPVFVAIVGLAPGAARAPVHYREGGKYITVPAGGNRVVGSLPAAFNGSSHVLIVLTYTPAGEAARESLDGNTAGGPADAARDALKSSLENLGYAGAAVELVRVDG